MEDHSPANQRHCWVLHFTRGKCGSVLEGKITPLKSYCSPIFINWKESSVTKIVGSLGNNDNGGNENIA